MKNKLLTLLFGFLMFFIPNVIYASNATIKISAPDSVYVGDDVKVSVTLSSSSSIGSWQYNISYDDAVLSFVSSTSESPQQVASYATSAGKTSVTYSWNFKAKNTGSTSFKIDGVAVYAFDDDSEMGISGSTSKTIKIVKPSSSSGSSGGSSSGGSSNNYTYSSNNNLSSLTIEGFEFEFDNEKSEFSVNVPNETKKIKVGATAEDNKATVNGIGEYDLVEGNNDIQVIVKAENGNTKTYILHVNVLELAPVSVTVDDNSYTLIRKSELLPKTILTFPIDSVLIKGETIPCYYSELNNLYLVGLRDEAGIVYLYKYDNVNDKFSKYDELSVGGIFLSLANVDSMPEGYKIEKIKINNISVDSYTKEGVLPLIYGLNLETGKYNYYTYDSLENTIQRFEFSNKTDNSSFYSLTIMLLIVIIIVQFIIMIVISKNKKTKKKLVEKLENNTNHTNDNDNLSKDSYSFLEKANFEEKNNKKKNKKQKKGKDNNTDNMYKF